ncbi:MAG: 16S rRNA (guanine(527)-N(7))-methyltransferase RsmG [Firmicutes bacterium]|nr:16S rRNA (guanine(527)-N(7))-methyltransferase RsmG [Bacillota bacterium]
MEINEFINKIKKLGINITESQLQQLEQYYELLIEENKVMNLTRIIEKKEVYLKHFYDSLTLCKIIPLNKNKKLCDIGSGAGFPGIVLKIVFPNLNITLLDSLNKRVVFLNKIIKELNLKDIEAIHCRAEVYSRENVEKYDIVTARAVAKTNILLEIASPMIKINGSFVAMKANIEDEITNINHTCKELNCKLEKIETFKLPIENSIRNLIKFTKINSTNIKYPRKFEQIKKNPL